MAQPPQQPPVFTDVLWDVDALPQQPPVFTDVLWDVDALPRLPAGVSPSATIVQPAPMDTGNPNQNAAMGVPSQLQRTPAVPVLPWPTHHLIPSNIPFAVPPPAAISSPSPNIVQTSTISRRPARPTTRPTTRPQPKPSPPRMRTTSFGPSAQSSNPTSALKTTRPSIRPPSIPSSSTTSSSTTSSSITSTTSSSSSTMSSASTSSPITSSTSISSSTISPSVMASSAMSSSAISSSAISSSAISSSAISSSTMPSSTTSSSVPLAGIVAGQPPTQTPEPAPSSSSSNSKTIAIAVSVPLGVLAICLLAVCVFFILRRRSRKKADSGAGSRGIDTQGSGGYEKDQERDLLDLYAGPEDTEVQPKQKPYNTPTPPAPPSAIFGGFSSRPNHPGNVATDEKHRNLMLPQIVAGRKSHNRNASNFSNASIRSLLPRRNKPSPTYPEVAYLYDPEVSPPQPSPAAARALAPTSAPAPVMDRPPSPRPPPSIVNNPLQIRNPTPTFNGVPIIAAPRPSRSRSQSRSNSPYTTAIPMTIPSAPVRAPAPRDPPASSPAAIDAAAATASTNANVERAAERERISLKPPVLSLRTTNLDMGGFYEPTVPGPSGFVHRDSRGASDSGDEAVTLPNIHIDSPSEYDEHAWNVAAGGLVPSRDLSRANRNKYSRDLRSFKSVVLGRGKGRTGSINESISSEGSEGSLIGRSGAIKRASRWEKRSSGSMSARPGQRDEEWMFLTGMRDSLHSM